MPRTRVGTWLDPAVAGDNLTMRCFLLAAVAGGFLQKPCVFLAVDGKCAIAQVVRLRRAKASRELLGTSVVLLYVAHASAAQSIVGDIACRLARMGGRWDRTAVSELRSKLLSLPPSDAGRRRGRLAKQSGPLWLTTLLRSRGGCGALLRIGRRVGDVFAGLRGCGQPVRPAAGSNCNVFRDVCEAFQQPGQKLPGIGQYGRVAIARLATACRFSLDGVCIEPCAEGWAHVRDMNKTTVAGSLRGCGVSTFGEALIMRNAVAGTAAGRSARTVAKFNKVTVADISLLACECYSLFAAGRKHGPRLRCQRTFARWCLERLPSNRRSFAGLSKSMHGRQAALQNVHPPTVADHRSAYCVMKAWLATNPRKLTTSVWSALHRGATLPWSLPVVACRGCGYALCRSGRSKSRLCGGCLSDRRRARDCKRRRIERAAVARPN